MCRAPGVQVDVPAIGLIVDDDNFRAGLAVEFGCQMRGRAVTAIENYAHDHPIGS